MFTPDAQHVLCLLEGKAMVEEEGAGLSRE